METARWYAGLALTHLDWHCLTDSGRADLFDLAMALDKQHGLAARVWLEYGRRKAREHGKPVVDNLFLDNYAVSSWRIVRLRVAMFA